MLGPVRGPPVRRLRPASVPKDAHGPQPDDLRFSTAGIATTPRQGHDLSGLLPVPLRDATNALLLAERPVSLATPGVTVGNRTQKRNRTLQGCRLHAQAFSRQTQDEVERVLVVCGIGGREGWVP